jgi:hypothetical protein
MIGCVKLELQKGGLELELGGRSLVVLDIIFRGNV